MCSKIDWFQFRSKAIKIELKAANEIIHIKLIMNTSLYGPRDDGLLLFCDSQLIGKKILLDNNQCNAVVITGQNLKKIYSVIIVVKKKH